jgi:hypothetical protein
MTNEGFKPTTLRKLAKLLTKHATDQVDNAAASLSATQEQNAANAVAEHAIKRQYVHGTGPEFVAKTPRADQRIAWKEIADKPDLALADFDLDDILSVEPVNGKAPKAPTMGSPTINDDWLSAAIARIVDLTWSNITGKPSTFPPSAHTHPSTAITDFQEASEDVIGSALEAGPNIAIDYDDSTGKTTIAATSTGDLTYRHVQSSPSATWTVTHNLGKYVAVSVVDSAGDLVFGDVHYDSSDQVTISFSAAFGGEAYAN